MNSVAAQLKGSVKQHRNGCGGTQVFLSLESLGFFLWLFLEDRLKNKCISHLIHKIIRQAIQNEFPSCQ